MIKIRIIFADPNLKSYIHNATDNEIDCTVNISQDDNKPFPLIRKIQISRMYLEE